MRRVTQTALVDACRRFMEVMAADGDDPDGWLDVVQLQRRALEMADEDRARAEGRQFAGAYYNPARDDRRLLRQLGRVYAALSDGGWWTLAELAETTGDPPASISAQLRHLRKPQHGGYLVDVEAGHDRAAGLYRYRLRNPDGSPPTRSS